MQAQIQLTDNAKRIRKIFTNFERLVLRVNRLDDKQGSQIDLQEALNKVLKDYNDLVGHFESVNGNEQALINKLVAFRNSANKRANSSQALQS